MPYTSRIISHFNSFVLCFTMSHHFGCYTASSLLASECHCELLCLDGLLHVIAGILAGGIRGFRVELCCLLTQRYGLVMCVLLGSWSPCHCCSAIPISEMIQCYPLSITSVFWIGLSVTSLSVFVGSFVSVACFVFCFCVVCVCLRLACLFLLCVMRDCDCAGLCTGPFPIHFCAPLRLGLVHTQFINYLLLCNMQRNMLNDLARAKRRWTEKKINRTASV